MNILNSGTTHPIWASEKSWIEKLESNEQVGKNRKRNWNLIRAITLWKFNKENLLKLVERNWHKCKAKVKN
jgi:hypothetical protein